MSGKGKDLAKIENITLAILFQLVGGFSLLFIYSYISFSLLSDIISVFRLVQFSFILFFIAMILGYIGIGIVFYYSGYYAFKDDLQRLKWISVNSFMAFLIILSIIVLVDLIDETTVSVFSVYIISYLYFSHLSMVSINLVPFTEDGKKHFRLSLSGIVLIIILSISFYLIHIDRIMEFILFLTGYTLLSVFIVQNTYIIFKTIMNIDGEKQESDPDQIRKKRIATLINFISILSCSILIIILFFFIGFSLFHLSTISTILIVTSVIALFFIMIQSYRYRSRFGFHYSYSIAVSVSVVLVIMIILAGLNLVEYNTWYSYDRSINRDFSNTTQEEIIQKTECLDYTYILNRSRFEYQSGGNHRFNASNPNFIDREVVEYYWDYIGYLQDNNKRGNCYMEYNCQIYYLDKIKVSVYENEYGHLMMSTSTDPDFLEEEHYFEWGHIYSIKNGSQYDIYSTNRGEEEIPEMDANFSNCYLGVMELDYGRQTYPLAGWGFYINQYVVIDENLEVQMVTLSYQEWIS